MEGPRCRANLAPMRNLLPWLCGALAAAVCPFFSAAQNVGVGVSDPRARLHVAGALRLDGDTLTGNLDRPATILHLVANGGVSVKLDANDDGSERFTVKRSGPDLGSVVFEATEAGQVTAAGGGDFDGPGRFNGHLTLDGDSRDLLVGENFDLLAEGSVEILLDTDGDNASADFGVRASSGDWLLLLEEDKPPTVYPHGTASGKSGAIRLRELAAGGSSWVGLRAPDALGGNVWLTLPGTDGAAGQFLQTDGTGLLSWADPPALAPAARMAAARTLVWGAGDSARVGLGPAGQCRLEGVEREDAAVPAAGGCRLEGPDGPSAEWRLAGRCTDGCRRLRCTVRCSPP